MKQFLSFFFILIGAISFSQTPYALELDGTDDYVLMGDVNDLGTSDFTVEAWFYAESFGTNGGKIINKGETAVGAPAEAGYGIRFGHSGLQRIDANIHGDTGPYYDLFYEPIQFNTWYHVAMVRRFDKLLLYVDCILVDSLTITPNLNIDTDMPLAIGGKDKGGLSFNDNFHDGYIDEVRIWTTSRTVEQICDWKDCTIDGPMTDLLAVYNMDHSTGVVAADNSGNGNDGALQDQATWAASIVGTGCYLGTDALENENFEVYPMPSNDKIFLKNVNTNCNYEIYNLDGKLLISGQYFSTQSIDISDLSEGIYLLRLIDGKVVNSLRFVKE